MSQSDRRKHPRVEGKFPVDLLNMGDDPTVSPFEAVIPAVALDVSQQGLRLRSSYQVPVGTILSVILYYKDRGSVCLCEVMWKRDEAGECLYGLYIAEWSQLDPALARRLEEADLTKNQTHSSSSVMMSSPNSLAA